MKRILLISFFCLLHSAALYCQSGSINNTLGTGGSFKVKSAASDSLLVVKENGSVGIGTSTPASRLDIAGQMTADQVKVDGIPSFFATHVEQTGLTNAIQTLTTWDETSYPGAHDNASSFNPSTGQFVVPRNGFYFLSAHIQLSGTGGSGAEFIFKINSSFSGLRDYTPTSYSGSTAMLHISGVLKLSVGQIVTLVILPPGSVGSCTAGEGYFSGYLVSDF